MADFRAEQNLDSGMASSPVFSNWQLQDLWNLSDIQALNNREQSTIAQLPTTALNSSNSPSVIAPYAGGFSSTNQVLINRGILPGATDLLHSLNAAEQKDKVAQSGENQTLPTLVPSPEQLGLNPIIDSATEKAGVALEQKWNPYRGRIEEAMREIPATAWKDAYEAFPQFKQAGLSEKHATELMKAIVRNELYHYSFFDKADDDQAREHGTPFDLPKRPAEKATLGYSQLSPKAVDERAQEYPAKIGEFKGHEVQTLLDPAKAPLLVSATLAHNIEMYQRHHIAITEQTLAYSYNPPDERILPTQNDLAKSKHASNVLNELNIIRGLTQPKGDQR